MYPRTSEKIRLKSEARSRNLEEFAGSWRSRHDIINCMAFCMVLFERNISSFDRRFIQVIQISLFYIGRYFFLPLALSSYSSNLGKWVNLFINASHWSAFIKRMKKIVVYMKGSLFIISPIYPNSELNWWPGCIYLLWEVQHFFWWAVSVDWYMELSHWGVPCNNTVRDATQPCLLSADAFIFLTWLRTLEGYYVLNLSNHRSFNLFIPLGNLLNIFHQHNSSHHACEEYQLWWMLGRNYLKKRKAVAISHI